MDDGLGSPGRQRSHTLLVLQGHFNLSPSTEESSKVSGISRSKGTPSGNQAKSKHTRRRGWKETLGQKEQLLKPILPLS